MESELSEEETPKTDFNEDLENYKEELQNLSLKLNTLISKTELESELPTLKSDSESDSDSESELGEAELDYFKADNDSLGGFRYRLGKLDHRNDMIHNTNNGDTREEAEDTDDIKVKA